MGTRRSLSLYFHCGSAAQLSICRVLVGAAWVWLCCCFRRSGSVPWTLDYRRGWMNYAIFSAFSMGNCFEAKPSAISVKLARCSSAVSSALPSFSIRWP